MIHVRAFKIEMMEGSYSPKAYFELSMREFRPVAPSTRIEDYDYVQLVPTSSYRKYPSGNDGSQGWRHRRTGWTIPDYCRQSGGYPDIWTKTHKRNLSISEDSPIWKFLIVH